MAIPPSNMIMAHRYNFPIFELINLCTVFPATSADYGRPVKLSLLTPPILRGPKFNSGFGYKTPLRMTLQNLERLNYLKFVGM